MEIRPRQLLIVSLLITFVFSGTHAEAQVIASDLTNSTSTELISFSNPSNGAFVSAGDGFQKYQRGVSLTIPFSVLDDSISSYPADTLGIIDDNNLDIFFGVVDTINPENTSGALSATWVFNIAGATDLALSIDMGAMGDFEASDNFMWEYSIDGGPVMTAFDGIVDDAGANTYTLAGGLVSILNDPMTVQGESLSNTLQTFSTLLSGTGSQLTLILTATANGGSEAFVFQNIEINGGGLPLDIVAFDLVDSSAQNLTNFDNPFAGAFGSAGDGFEIYQRGVSSSIPFSVLDDSLVTFTTDSLGIVDDNNLDTFFGITDTVNGDNSGQVSAAWTFDISGAENLGLLIDMGAMGDFESSDTFTWTYSIDGAPTITAFVSDVDEAASNTYTLAGGGMFTLSDPMTMQGNVLTNVLTQFSTSLTGSGNVLELTLTADTNGGTEAFAFQNIIIAQGFQPDEPEPTPVLEIFEIQSDEASSPFNGDVVESLDNVVTALASNGFFMQTPTSRTDGNIDTSDGIFVFTGGAPSVVVGDMVSVLAEVDEFFGFTELTNNPVLTVTGSGVPLPAAVIFDAVTPSPDPTNPSCAIEFECYESMLVQIAHGSVTGSNQRFGVDPIAEVHITAAENRTFREIGIEFPGIPGLPVWDENPEVFELDPDKLGLPNRTIAAGSTFSATGVVGFEFGGYELWPTGLTVSEAILPRPVREKNKKEVSVGSLNLFRLFDDFDDAPITNSLGETINDQVVTSEEYERRLTKIAKFVVSEMKTPDVLAVQEVEKLGVLEDLAEAISLLDKKSKYRAFLSEGNDIGSIDVGFLVRKKTKVRSVTQLGATDTFVVTGTGRLDLLHDRPPLLLEIKFDDFEMYVMVVHNRSLGGITTSRVQQKRFEQAQSIARMVQELQIAEPEAGLVIIGDFNAFEFTDSYVDAVGQISGFFNPADNLLSGDDLVDPNLMNQVLLLPEHERYSFVFRGNAQTLDHALTNQALDLRVRGLQFARGNADAAVDLINDESSPLRVSDHDGLVLYVYTGELEEDEEDEEEDDD